jgi:molybdopterin synthase sulfur carrier subunit
MVEIKIPTPLRKLTDGKDLVEVEAATVREALSALDAKHPGVLAKICDDSGNVRRFVNIYAGDEDIRFLGQLETALASGARLSIIPAIAGGV